MSTPASTTTTTTTTAQRPTTAQRRILTALASRPAAKIINGPYGVFLTDGRGWSPSDVHITTAQLVALIAAGWVTYTQAPMGRAEYRVTVAGRAAVAE
jgi:hypothetical protein